MGNRALCSEVNLRCATAHCTRIALGERSEGQHLVEGQGCEPAGAVFEETLDALEGLERQLLLFCSSANAVAVRWLLRLGAGALACDSNATTCLHAACRGGSATVAEALLAVGGEAALAAADVAGWTPLHVAAFMGRAELVALLLRHGATPARKTLAGRVAAELCSDGRTKDLLVGASPHPGGGAAAPRSAGSAGGSGPLSVEQAMPGVNLLSAREVRFEPFFVPRNPVIAEPERSPELSQRLVEMARSVFNRQPGRGLAFLVASGCVRDYPINLVGFLRGGGLDGAHIGAFLGEDFSLSKILRMEFINTVGFASMGVIGSLKSTFTQFRAPPDLQKLDRILGSLADVWWRQHCRAAASAFKAAATTPAAQHPPAREGAAEEPRGLELKRLLPSVGTLHQLLFSSMMLHWSLHAAEQPSQRVGAEEWCALHRGVAGSRGDLPEQLLLQLYEALSGAEIEQLRFSDASLVGRAAGGGQGAVGPLPSSSAPSGGPGVSAMTSLAQIEGWVRVTGCGLPAPLGAVGGNGTANGDCMQLSNMLSEATASSRRRHPDSSQDAPTVDSSSLHASSLQVWLSLCHSVLFLSIGPGPGSPFAFVHLRTVQFSGLEPARASFAIDGGPGGGVVDPPRTPLQLVFLLPDGRWQSFDIPRLEVEVCDHSQMEGWVMSLTELCSAASVL